MEDLRIIIIISTLLAPAFVTGYENIRTTGNNRYTWLNQYNRDEGFITFDVQAERDAFITLTQKQVTPGKWDTYMDSYTVMMGAFNNMKFCLNEGHVICKSEHAERGVLHAHQFRSFWISWKDGLVQMGKGCTPGRYWMLEYRYQSVHGVINVGVKTQGPWGNWRFGPGACSGNYGTGGASEPDQVGGMTVYTPDSGVFKTVVIHLQPQLHTMLVFDVKADHDIGLLLSADQRNVHINHYSVSIGALRNTQTCIGKWGKHHCLAEGWASKVIKNQGATNSYWVAFRAGIVEVGRGDTYSDHWRYRLARYEDPQPLAITTIGIRTMMGATGQWTIRKVTQAPMPGPKVCPPMPAPPPHPCPDHWPGLRSWSPGNQPWNDFILENGNFLMTSSVHINSLIIRNGGKLIFKYNSGTVTLRTRSILIQDGGELHIGSEYCRYQGKAEIVLTGLSTDDKRYEHPKHGRKYIAVEKGGTLEIHGQEKRSWSKLQGTLKAGNNNPKIRLENDITSWKPGDKIFIATTDFSLEQSEDFTVDICKDCSPTEVRLKGEVKYDHYGLYYNKVDMRAEVGMLTYNVVVRGDMQNSCYGTHMTPNYCRFFKHDTFGGHIIIHLGFKNVHLSSMEVTNMGQQVKARYPVHFHMCDDVDEVGCYSRPAYVKGISVHHCFDRCVAIHGTDGLLVQDTVSYESLGHCYFLEDGGEQRNVLDHNLGVNIRYGTTEPSDRNSEMCRSILDWTWPGYIPDPNNCNAVSTFWISHPNNTFTNNAASGSVGTGYWYIFRHAPSGPSEGKLPPNHISTSSIGRFDHNKATGHHRAGLMIDFGLKIGPATASSPSEFLAMSAGHFKPKTPALLSSFTATKCDQGAWMRGGNINLVDSRFADNIVGLTFASAGEMTADGEHCEGLRMVFVGRSPNVGTNKYFQRRTISGFRIYDGPLLIGQSTFTDFVPTDGNDKTHAISFFGGPFQMTPKNQVTGIMYDQKSVRGRASRSVNRDAEKTEIFCDRDGSTTGYRDSCFINNQNYINRHSGCVHYRPGDLLICGGKHASLYIRRNNPNNIGTRLVRDEYSDRPMELTGFGNIMHTLLLGATYTLHFQGPSPQEVTLRMVNFDVDDWVRVGVCYETGTTFDVYYETSQRTDKKLPLTRVYNIWDVDNGDGLQYFWDQGARLLIVKPRARLQRAGWWYYPEGYGTEQIRIRAHTPGGSGDCRKYAYPRYARAPTSRPLIPGGCGPGGCGAPSL